MKTSCYLSKREHVQQGHITIKVQWNLVSLKHKGLGFFIQTERSMYQKV